MEFPQEHGLGRAIYDYLGEHGWEWDDVAKTWKNEARRTVTMPGEFATEEAIRHQLKWERDE